MKNLLKTSLFCAIFAVNVNIALAEELSFDEFEAPALPKQADVSVEFEAPKIVIKEIIRTKAEIDDEVNKLLDVLIPEEEPEEGEEPIKEEDYSNIIKSNPDRIINKNQAASKESTGKKIRKKLPKMGSEKKKKKRKYIIKKKIKQQNRQKITAQNSLAPAITTMPKAPRASMSARTPTDVMRKIKPAKPAFTSIMDNKNKLRPNSFATMSNSRSVFVMASDGNNRALKALLDLGMSINISDSSGDTPLMIAAKKGRIKTVRFLITQGADIDAQNKKGLTALHIAVYKRSPEIVYELIERGANIEIQDKNRHTPALIAIYKGYNNIAELLITSGADINVESISGNDLVMTALKRGYIKTAKLLIESGADVDSTDSSGNSLLHISAYNNLIDLAKILLAENALPSEKNNQGVIAEDIAIARNHFAIASMIAHYTEILDAQIAKVEVFISGNKDEFIGEIPEEFEFTEEEIAQEDQVANNVQEEVEAIIADVVEEDLDVNLEQAIEETPDVAIAEIINNLEEVSIPEETLNASVKADIAAKADSIINKTVSAEIIKKEIVIEVTKAPQEIPRPKQDEPIKWDELLTKWTDADRKFEILTMEEKIYWNEVRKELESKFEEHFKAPNPESQVLLDEYMKRWYDLDALVESVKQDLDINDDVSAPEAEIESGNSGKTAIEKQNKLQKILNSWKAKDDNFATLSHGAKIALNVERNQLIDMISAGKIMGEYADEFDALDEAVKADIRARMEKWDAFEEALNAQELTNDEFDLEAMEEEFDLPNDAFKDEEIGFDDFEENAFAEGDFDGGDIGFPEDFSSENAVAADENPQVQATPQVVTPQVVTPQVVTPQVATPEVDERVKSPSAAAPIIAPAITPPSAPPVVAPPAPSTATTATPIPPAPPSAPSAFKEPPMPPAFGN